MKALGQIWFVGAGPGDPDLITVKGRRLVEQAGAILYAGSLVDPAATRWAAPDCLRQDSSGMTLEAIGAWLIAAARRHPCVVRLQTGDPAIYGALPELTRGLDAAGVPWQVVPGVTAATAAAAAAGISLTLPEGTQTLILTRAAGRTPVPAGEDLRALAAHGCTLCIYLSVRLLPQVQQALRAAGWPATAPLLVVQRASWAGAERIVRGTLSDIDARCATAGIDAQAMIIAGPTLALDSGPPPARSRLYDPAFSHGYRRAEPAADPAGTAPSRSAAAPPGTSTHPNEPEPNSE
ncbi:MAG: precorrin-4 C(11)-methyltransferase [Chromatiaceae bacterium]|nr:MAG: precorrin-4 C(11)-methyltransferase [Chromatiaceae bacterium]